MPPNHTRASRRLREQLEALDLISAEAIVKRSTRVTVGIGRHTRQTVELDGEDGAFLKFAGTRSPGGLARELRANVVLAELKRSQPELTRHLPELIETHASETRLVWELVPHATSLRALVGRAQMFDPGLFRDLGSILRRVHSASRPLARVASSAPSQPWLISVKEVRAAACVDWSMGQRQVIETLHNMPALADVVKALACLNCDDDHKTFIHGDLKWDNVLVSSSGSVGPARVVLVDWEFSGIGHPLWDVGTVLGEFLVVWGLSIPIIDPVRPDRYVHLAAISLQELQPAMRAFWDGYTGAEPARADLAARWATDAARFAGARIVQAAYERAQVVSQLTPHLNLLIQLGLNVIQSPAVAAEGLMGIPPAGADRG